MLDPERPYVSLALFRKSRVCIGTTPKNIKRGGIGKHQKNQVHTTPPTMPEGSVLVAVQVLQLSPVYHALIA